MDKICSIETTDGVTSVRFSTKPGENDIFDAIDDIAENHLSPMRLWDLSNGCMVLTSDQIREIAEYSKSKLLLPSKVAIIAPEDLIFGLSRIYEVFSSREQTQTRTFRTEPKALSWLKSQSL